MACLWKPHRNAFPGLRRIPVLVPLICLLALPDIGRAVERPLQNQPTAVWPFRSPVASQPTSDWTLPDGSAGRRTLRFLDQPRQAISITPARRIRLVNGDEITAVLMAGDRRSIEFQIFGDQRLKIACSSIESISAMPGERELLAADFAVPETWANLISPIKTAPIRNGVLHVADAKPVTFSLPETAENLRGEFQFRLIGKDLKSAAGMGWSWLFADASRIAVRLHPLGRWHADPQKPPLGPATQQAIAADLGWHIGRIQTMAGRVFLTIDDQLLYAGPMLSRITALEFAGNVTDPSPKWELQIAYLAIVETHRKNLHMPGTAARPIDEVVSADGESWWGDVTAVGPSGVEWTAANAVWRRSWPQLQQMVWRSASDPVEGRPVCGHIVRLRLHPTADDAADAGDFLTVALGPSAAERLLVDHPLLGRIAVPYTAIRRVNSQFLGEWRLLDARESSLKRPSLHSSKSSSLGELAGSFLLHEPPGGAVFFSLEALGLEPSGPQTPPGSPTLKGLRAGQGVTELHINQHRVGTMNELTSQWSLPGQFDRLRLRLPTELLKRGANSWRISQTPGNVSPRWPNGCRFRNCSLEIEASIP